MVVSYQIFSLVLDCNKWDTISNYYLHKVQYLIISNVAKLPQPTEPNMTFFQGTIQQRNEADQNVEKFVVAPFS